MRTFDLKKNVSVACESQNTRSGFRHIAILLVNGNEVDRTKVCYQNRTWESYEFESVLMQLIKKTKILNEKETKAFRTRSQKKSHDEVQSMFNTLIMVASLGEVFCEDKNDWKLRMIKAMFIGLYIPEDWDTLSEEDKEFRLNKVIEFAQVDD